MSEQVELLVFELGENEYVVDVSKVNEVRGFDGVSRVPDRPSFMRG
ncbi:chemotaxis protein CheW [Pseudomonas sp. A4]|nr:MULTISPECIES: chemotaxis protein CheW [unclassified Pseudomonas]MCR8931754.1 chemotaxis protein CheW [Pseudomonas sp. S11A4]MCR8975360.1 chemotaxis protein CheW [Pseudomonas sp. S11P7]